MKYLVATKKGIELRADKVDPTTPAYLLDTTTGKSRKLDVSVGAVLNRGYWKLNTDGPKRIAKHPGPHGSPLHSTGTDQSVHGGHGGSRISPFNASLHGTDNTVAALPEKLRSKVVAKWEAVTGQSRRRIIAQYRRLLRRAEGNPNYKLWKYWYDDAHDLSTKIAKENGYTVEQVAAAFAAYSPGVNWDEELKVVPHLAEMMATDAPIPDDVLELLNAKLANDAVLTGRSAHERIEPIQLKSGDRVSSIGNPRAAAIAYLEVARAGPGDNWATPYGYGFLMDAVKAFRGVEPDALLRGVKTRSFYNNIIIPEGTDDVTIDFQMMEAAARRTLTKNEVTGLNGTPSITIAGVESSVGARPYLADIVRHVAPKYGLTPLQAQAIIWNQWKEEKSE